jgi:hypothetical protein
VVADQPRPARDAAHALERGGGVVRGQGRVQAGARAAERDPARGMVQPTSRSPISLIAFPTLALSTISTASADGRWCCSTSLDQQLRRPYMDDRPSICSGNVSEFIRAAPLLVLGREAGQPRPQWTTAQDDPPTTGRHAKPCRNARQLHHRRRAGYCQLLHARPARSSLKSTQRLSCAKSNSPAPGLRHEGRGRDGARPVQGRAGGPEAEAGNHAGAGVREVLRDEGGEEVTG